MTKRRFPLVRKSIGGRLLLWFLVFALVPCIGVTALTYLIARRSLEISVRQRLSIIAESKITQLENFMRERRGDAAVLGGSSAVAELVQGLEAMRSKSRRESPEYRAVERQQLSAVSLVQEIYDYRNIYFLNLRGDLLTSLQPGLDFGPNLMTGTLKDTELGTAFRRAISLLQTVTADFQIYPGRKEPISFIVGPIMKEGILLGVIVFEFKNEEVFRVVKDYSGLGETGETLVTTRIGNDVVDVASSRFDPDSAFKGRLPIGAPVGLPMQESVLGKRGYGIMFDPHRDASCAAVWRYLPSYRWGMVVKQDLSEAYLLISELTGVVLVLLVITAVLVIFVSRRVARSLTLPVRKAAEVAMRIAQGDLGAEVESNAIGELGQLLEAIKTLSEYLRSLIGRIQKSSVALMSTATEIAAASRQQEQTVGEYGAATNQSVTAVQQITATSQELSRTMDEVRAVAAGSAQSALSGRQNLDGMSRTMRQLADSTGSIGAKLSVISERAGNINLVVTTITKVADQTNLLSINAAIEAEKAGEYGFGFLVVAREIRRLADQTAVATLDIERMVKEMQYSVSAGVMEMDKFAEQVRQGVHEVGQVGEQLTSIIADVQTVSSRFEQVSEGMRAQALGANQIRGAMVRLSEGARRTSQSLQEFNKANSHLRDAVSGLTEEVAHFNLGPSPAMRTLESRADSSTEPRDQRKTPRPPGFSSVGEHAGG